MGISNWWIVVVSVWFSASLLVWHRVRLHLRRRLFQRAKREFRWQRERLEAKFVQISEQRTETTQRPWVHCDFDDEVTFVRSRASGQLSAFVSITITIENSPADPELHRIINPILPFLSETPSKIYREATGVFIYNKTHWDTDGRVVFNLSPSETIRFYRRDLQEV